MIPDSVAKSIELRVPVFATATPPRQRVDQLESYLLLAAFHQGEIAAERLDLYDDIRLDEEDWRRIPTEEWEQHRTGTTLRSIDDAKEVVRPQLAESLREKRWKLARMNEEIDRLERDATKVSRAYTLISGS